MKFFLNKANWRCGTNYGKDVLKYKNGLGKGPTFLLNEEGYMCCLGQISEQLGVKHKHMKNVAGLDELETIYSGIYSDKLFILDDDFVNEAMDINDNCNTTVDEKVSSLIELVESRGHELEVIDDIHCTMRL